MKNVYSATITHRHGANTFTNETEEGLIDAIFTFCSVWSSELVSSTVTEKDLDVMFGEADTREKKEEAIKFYFENHNSDFLEYMGIVPVGK